MLADPLRRNTVFDKRIIAIASLTLLAGCKSSATAPLDPVGEMMFAYAGSAISGNWSANGAKDATPIVRQTNPWASSRPGSSTVFVESMTPASSTTHHFAQLTIRRNTVGTETLTAGCSGTCSRLYIMFGAPNAGASNLFLMECTMTVGSITISAITSNRATGTFSGTGSCTPGTGGGGTFTVTNGTFDTAIMP